MELPTRPLQLCPAQHWAWPSASGPGTQAGGGALPFLHFKGLTAPRLLSPFLFVAEFGSVPFFFFLVVLLCHGLNYRFEHLIIRNTFFRLLNLTYLQSTLLREHLSAAPSNISA